MKKGVCFLVVTLVFLLCLLICVQRSSGGGELSYDPNDPQVLQKVQNYFIQQRDHGQAMACLSNLKNIATGLEMFSTDHRGIYPRSLSELSPEYLRVLPTCPKAGMDTYSASYRAGKEGAVSCPLFSTS